MAWTTGTSSPWVKAYEITELAKHDDSSILYRVVFTYTDSASSEYQEIHNVSVKKIRSISRFRISKPLRRRVK